MSAGAPLNSREFIPTKCIYDEVFDISQNSNVKKCHYSGYIFKDEGCYYFKRLPIDYFEIKFIRKLSDSEKAKMFLLGEE